MFAVKLLTMLNAFKIYLAYISVSFRSQMQYRASFIMQSTGQFLINGVEFLGIWALFDRFGSIGGWGLAEVALLYGMVNSAFALTDATSRGFDTFATMVKSGDFDRLLLRPRSTALQLAGQELTLRRVGRFLQGLIILLWACSALNVTWTVGKIVFLMCSMLGGSCFFYGLLILQATAAFWTTESLELANITTYGGVETAQYPLHIYRPWFRKFFTFVLPLAFVNYYPAMLIVGNGEAAEIPAVLLYFSPLFGIFFLAISLQIWKIGTRHYRSTGS
jgi:ABC-2 type transport system permease protein